MLIVQVKQSSFQAVFLLNIPAESVRLSPSISKPEK